jgi:hypothetical protein
LVGAVGNALDGCRLTGGDAAEAAAQAAIVTANAFEVIDLGSASAGGAGGTGGGNGLAPMGASEIGTTGGRIGSSCQGGGTRDESCTLRSGRAQLEIVFDACTVTIGAQQLVVDGRLTRTVDDLQFCETGQIGDRVEVTDALTDFRQTTTRPDGGGASVFELSGTYTRRFVFTSSGCNGGIGTEHFDGDLAFRCTPAMPSGVAGCPAGGRDLALVARDLTVNRARIGVGVCPPKTVFGRLEVDDRISGQAFDTVYRNFVVAEAVRETGEVDLQLEGGLTLDCLGEVSIVTEVPLRRSPSAGCPSRGILLIRLPDGLQHAVRYHDGGLEIDLDGDGKPDRTTATCEDPSLAQCQ